MLPIKMLQRSGGKWARCMVAPDRALSGVLLGTFEELRCYLCGDDIYPDDDSVQLVDAQPIKDPIIFVCPVCGPQEE